jgi:diguanylate cyclase (GGDEF)-like protein
MSGVQSTTLAVRSDDQQLVGWLAAVVAGAAELRMVLPEAGADITLVDDRLHDAADVVGRLASEGRLCVALSDGADLDRLVRVLDAGAGGCVAREPEAAVMRGNLVAATRGTFQIPGRAWRPLIERLGAPAVAQHERPAIDLALLEDVVARRRFELVFQPIADLRSGEILALESLARFTAEPALPPNVWLEEAERAGLRIPLEHELLRASLATLADVPEHIALSVNLSPAAAEDPALHDVLDGAALHRLVLELTDHRQLADYEPLAEALAPLRAAGLRLAVDDSGQGLSSLQQVAQLAPNFLKVNRTLTRDIDRDATKHALAYALSAFAAQLDASVIAEGLETPGELRTLRDLGAQSGQGYLLARPRPLAELDLSRPLELAAGDDGGPAEPAGPGLQLRGTARDDFREAARAALRFLAERHPAATVVVAHLDYVRRRHTVVAARGPLAGRLEPGASMPLEDTMCFHMAAGRGSRVCPDVREDLAYGRLPLATLLDAGSYMGVPLQLPEGARFGTIFAVSPAPRAFSRADLAVMDDVGAVLGAVLLRQTAGIDRGRLLRFLRNLARTDGLTGVLNAPGMRELLGDELRRPPARRPGAYAAVEIDDLGSLREEYGRAVGELVLKDVAAALEASRHKADVVGRVGENRFALLLLSLPCEEALADLLGRLAPRLTDAAARRELTIRVRIGAVALGEVHDVATAWDQAVEHAETLS